MGICDGAGVSDLGGNIAMTENRDRGPRPRVALVGPEIEENLALRYLASALELAGVEVDIVPFNASEELGLALESILGAGVPPDVVALSLAFQWRATDFLALALALRQRGYQGHITSGGHFGSFTFREVLTDFPEVDSVCLHEAEETLPELTWATVQGRDLGRVAGLAFRDDAGQVVSTPVRRPRELATLAWPDRRGQPTSCLGHPIATLVAGRGCYAGCAFCCIAAWHRLAAGGPRFRLRPVDDVADEMAWLHRQQGTEIFIFHDDNFFLPTPRQSLQRIEALSAALRARGVRKLATVVKARPNDVTIDVFRAMRDRLGLIRLFLGIESNAPQGLRTLARGVSQGQNEAAMGILHELGIFVCFNLLVFDPDTTLDSLDANLAFMETHADVPFNFGRVELYAGTPLLARMAAEGRARGDYLGWDYRLGSHRVEQVFARAKHLFYPRNFARGAPANRLMGTRFDVEVCRRFHPDVYRAAWLEESKDLSRRLALDSVSALRSIVRSVLEERAGRPARGAMDALATRMRGVEADALAQAARLEAQVRAAVGAGCQHARPRAVPLGVTVRDPGSGSRQAVQAR